MNLFFAVGALLLVGVFAWELSLYLLAKDQLKTCVEVAALTCETTICSSGDPTDPANQTSAINTAVNLFSQNSILGGSLTGAQLVGSPAALSPGPGQAAICFRFLDPVTRSPTQVIGVQGAIIEADGAYCYQPIFGQFLLGAGSFTFTVLVSAQAGLPREDVVICLDLCGVGDDATMVTFVQRFWDYQINPPHIAYMIPWLNNQNRYAFGMFGFLNCFPADPNNANVNPPMNLGAAENTNNTCQINWSESPGMPGGAVLLAGGVVNGPPGNLCPGATVMKPTKIEIAKASKKTKLTAQRPSRMRKNKLADDTSRDRLQPAQNTQASMPTENGVKDSALDRRTVSSNPLEQYKLCTDPGWTKKDLEDVFVDLKSARDASSLFSKYSEEQIIAAAAPVGPTTTGGATYVMQQGGLMSGSSAPASVINIAIIPPANFVASCPTHPPYYSDPVTPFNGFTDLVANGDGREQFSGVSYMGYDYNDLAVLVEAARGNLESNGTASAAGLDLVALNATPQAGYQANYYQLASSMTQPFNVMRNGLQSFLDEVYRVADVHYGLVAFNGIVGTTPTSTFHKPKWDFYYTQAGEADYPIPQIILDPASGIPSTNYNTISTALPNLHVYGKRDTGLALRTALDQLDPANGHCRSWATKAVVLVTDGPPTHDSTSSLNPAGALAEAVAQADRAHNMGVPIYVLSVSLPSTFGGQAGSPDMGLCDQAYNENIAGSVCAHAGHGSKYYAVEFQDYTNTQRECVMKFGNIARQLTNLLK